MSSPPHETVESPERRYANELRRMFTSATEHGSAGMLWVDVIRTLVEASERFADAKDAERANLQRGFDAICQMPLDSADSVIQEFGALLGMSETPRQSSS